MSQKFTLTPEEFSQIHHYYKPAQNSLFPFPVTRNQCDQTIKNSLIQKGFLSSNGSPSTIATDILNTLNQAQNSTEIKLIFNGNFIEFQVFLTKTQQVLLHSKQQGIDVEINPDINETINTVYEVCGDSALQNLEIQQVFNIAESYAFACIVDNTRKAIHIKLGNAQNIADINLDKSAVLNTFNNTPDNLSSLTWFMDTLNLQKPSSPEIEQAIDSLSNADLIQINKNQITVSEEIIHFAYNFLFQPSLYKINCLQLAGNQAVKLNMAALQNSLQNLVFLEIFPTQITWSTISSKVFLSILTKTLTQPDFIPKPATQVPDNDTSNPCPYCNFLNPPTGKFCSGCGKDLSAKQTPAANNKKFCSGCGNPLKPGITFCPKCGKKLN
jgi:hypothetical protein